MYYELREAFMVIDERGSAVDTFLTHDEAHEELLLFKEETGDNYASIIEGWAVTNKKGELGHNQTDIEDWFEDEDEAEEAIKAINYRIAKAEHENRLETEAMEDYYENR